MATPQTARKMKKRNYKEQQLRCKQLNLQHSRAVTNNLMQLMAKENIGIALIQEPYLIRGKPQRITSRYRTFIAGGGNSWAAIVISDTRINALLITQHTDKDAVLLEIDDGQTHFYASSIYLDYRDPIENSIKTIEEIVKFTKDEKLIIAMESNSRSTTWHNVLTNFRGKVLEEFFASNQLHIINEDSNKTTFQNTRGSSNIDLTIVNNQMLAFIEDWAISEEESCSDHNTIKFNLNFTFINNRQQYQYSGTRFIMKEQQHTKFCKTFLNLISKKFQIDKDEENMEEIDEALNTQLKEHKDISEFIEKYEEAIQLTCKETLKLPKQQQTPTKGKSVPWWTDALTILRKRTNALRRRFQRTTNNEELRKNRKN